MLATKLTTSQVGAIQCSPADQELKTQLQETPHQKRLHTIILRVAQQEKCPVQREYISLNYTVTCSTEMFTL